jgi:hypothetical protein
VLAGKRWADLGVNLDAYVVSPCETKVRTMDRKRVSQAAILLVFVLAGIWVGRRVSVASYARREEDWQLQDSLASTESAEIDRQISAAESRRSR